MTWNCLPWSTWILMSSMAIQIHMAGTICTSGEAPVREEELHALEQHEEGADDQAQGGQPAAALAQLEHRLLDGVVVAAPDGVDEPGDGRPDPCARRVGCRPRRPATGGPEPSGALRSPSVHRHSVAPHSPHLGSAIVPPADGPGHARHCGLRAGPAGRARAGHAAIVPHDRWRGEDAVVVASHRNDDAATCPGRWPTMADGRGDPAGGARPNRSSRT